MPSAASSACGRTFTRPRAALRPACRRRSATWSTASCEIGQHMLADVRDPQHDPRRRAGARDPRPAPCASWRRRCSSARSSVLGGPRGARGGHRLGCRSRTLAPAAGVRGGADRRPPRRSPVRPRSPLDRPGGCRGPGPRTGTRADAAMRSAGSSRRAAGPSATRRPRRVAAGATVLALPYLGASRPPRRRADAADRGRLRHAPARPSWCATTTRPSARWSPGSSSATACGPWARHRGRGARRSWTGARWTSSSRTTGWPG